MEPIFERLAPVLPAMSTWLFSVANYWPTSSGGGASMANEVLLNKATPIERCVARAQHHTDDLLTFASHVVRWT